MKMTHLAASLALLAVLGSNAQAQSEKTREQVKAELAEAIRTGNVVANGELNLKLNELYPQRYPHAADALGATRAQVKADLAEAIRTGDMIANGETGLKLNQEFPQRYPAVAVAAGKTREQVKAELAEAIRTGDMIANGETGLKLNEEFPQRYAKARGLYARHAQESTSTAEGSAAR